MSIDRILIIRFSSLGDIILLTPLFREAKKRFPNARLDFLTSTTFASVCNNNPSIDSIYAFDRNRKGELARTITLVKENRYDLILDAHCSLRSRLLLLKAFGLRGIINKFIVSIDKRSWSRNLLIYTKINFLNNAITQREAYCKLLESVSADHSFDTATELFPGQTEITKVSAILNEFGDEDKPMVAIGPGASFKGKCWPKGNYLQLSDKLIQKGYRVVLLGGKEDEEPGWIIENSRFNMLNLAGKLSYLETAAILQRCFFTVSNDSAIVHFAESSGIPVLAIFGPTTGEFGYGPFLKNSHLVEIPLNCRPCSRNGKGECKNSVKRRCLKEITVDMIWNSIDSLERTLRFNISNDQK
jgi:lipopolysaccharide heptosyltransferase II